MSELTSVHAAQISKLRAEVSELRGSLGGSRPPKADAPPFSPPKRMEQQNGNFFMRESCSADEEMDQPTDGLDASVPEEVTVTQVENAVARPVALSSHTGWTSPLSYSQSSLSLREKKDEKEADEASNCNILQTLESEEDGRTEQALISRVADIFLGNYFEFAVAILLCINLLLMAAQLQYHGQRIGYEIGYRGYTLNIEEEFPFMESLFLGGDYVFAIIFTFEMLLGCKSKALVAPSQGFGLEITQQSETVQ